MRNDIERLLEGFRSEVVDERVKATVESGNTQGDWVESFGERLQRTVGYSLRTYKGIKEKDGIVGDKAHHENGDMHNYHLEHLFFVCANLRESGWLPESPQKQ
uniref:Uncharacterized protein n=1 Tax=Micrurus surinamensis TaxID=129470 RepID=A0A2D4Q2U6_MICSU